MRLLARFKTLLAMTVAVAGIGSRLDAGIITTVPAGLNPGDKYRLVFVTSTTWGAVSPDIGFYNAFVESLADATPGLQALGATWKAIGSTESVNAFDNIGASPSTVGIYRLDGEKVANGTAARFSGALHHRQDRRRQVQHGRYGHRPAAIVRRHREAHPATRRRPGRGTPDADRQPGLQRLSGPPGHRPGGQRHPQVRRQRGHRQARRHDRSEEHTSELQSL